MKVINETPEKEDKEIYALYDEMTDRNDHTGAALIEAVYYGQVKEAEKQFKQWLKREKEGGL